MTIGLYADKDFRSVAYSHTSVAYTYLASVSKDDKSDSCGVSLALACRLLIMASTQQMATNGPTVGSSSSHTSFARRFSTQNGLKSTQSIC